jgi:hypothetical protein
MAANYDESSLESAAVARVMVVEALRLAAKTRGSLDISWDSLRAALPDASIARARAVKLVAGIIRPPESRNNLDRPAFILAPISDSECGEESSSSASSSPSPEGGLAIPAAEEFSELEWTLPVGARATLHVVAERSCLGPRTVCNKNLGAAALCGVGLKSATAQLSPWCKMCLNKTRLDDPHLAVALDSFNS